MAVLKTRDRSAIEALEQRLGKLEEALPARAERLRDERRELEAELARLAARRLRRPSREELAALEERLGALERQGGRLGALLAAAAELEAEVAELRERARGGGDEEVRRWLEARAETWARRLAELGTEVGPADELEVCRRRLTEVEDAVRLHFQALYWIGQLDEAIAAFEGAVPQEVADAAARTRRELLASGAGAAWIERARRRAGDCLRRAEQESRRPAELNAVARRLPRLRAWAQELGFGAAEVKDLGRRYQAVAVEDWATALPGQLEQQARRLEAELTGRAAALRGERLAALRSRHGELAATCEVPPAPAEQLADLERRPVRRPQSHRGWLRELARAEERLAAIANNHRGELAGRLAGRLAELGDALAHLRRDPLSDAVAARARALEGRAAELAAAPAESSDGAAALEALHRAGEALAEVGELRRRALEEVEALRLEQQRLRVENAELLEQAALLGLESADLESTGLESTELESTELESTGLEAQIEALTLASAGAGSLERSQRAAETLAGQLAEHQRAFVEGCRERLDAGLAAAGTLTRALAEAGGGPPPAAPPGLDAGAGPAEAAASVLAVAEALAALRARSRAAAERLEAARREALAGLSDLEGDTALGPGEREKARSLAAALEAAALEGAASEDAASEEATSEEATAEGLRRLARLLAEVEAFHRRLEAAQREVEERTARLRERLRSFLDEGFDAFHPRWADRLIALVYGLGEAPAASADAEHQLAEAAALCERLESHARRLRAAREGAP